MSAARVRRAGTPRPARRDRSVEATASESVAGEEDPGAALDLPPPSAAEPRADARAADAGLSAESASPGAQPPPSTPARAGASRSGPRKPR